MPELQTYRPESAESRGNPLVLSVCETALGGVGRYQESLRGLSQEGFRLAILMPDKDAKILNNLSGVHTFVRQRRGVASLLRLVQVFLSKRRELRPNIYLFNSTFALVPLLVLRLCGDRSPAIYCSHCWAISHVQGAATWKGWLIRMVEGQLCGLANLNINVSQGDLAVAEQYGYRGKQVVVENAVPDLRERPATERFLRGSDDEVHLLFVGRFDRQKGLDILLAAFQIARQGAPHLRLHLVGGPVRGTESPDIPDGVVLHGWQSPDEIDSFYASADALVVPSRWEGLPLIVPESLRNGTPVFVADRSGMATLITPQATGGVFDLTVEALAGWLVSLQRTELRAMRSAARASYEQRFTMARFLPELASQLNALVGRPRA